MLFNSAIFLFAFSLLFVVYFFTAANANARKYLILVFSLIFYIALSRWGIFVLIAIAASDFFIVRRIRKTQNENGKRFLLYTAVCIDIGALLLFRHFTDWFQLNSLHHWPAVIGISFFVFRSIGYVLDAYNETFEDDNIGFTDYLTYIAYFPLILAGPISPSRDFLPQLKKAYNASEVPLGKVFFLLTSGVIKKYIFANYLSVNFVDRVFENAHLFTGIENIMATIAQAIIVYMDFSGYTDIVIGISLLLGLKITDNFNFPYISQNITEYWRRWHMSLSKWLNEYLYFPLSFSLRQLRTTGTIVAVFVTFILSGLWHGTSFHYTFWGMLHGVALGWDVATSKIRQKWIQNIPAFIYKGISIIITFSFLCLSGIFFKVNSMESGTNIIYRIFTKPDFNFFYDWFAHYPWVLAIIVTVLLLQFVLVDIFENIIAFCSRMNPILLALIFTCIIFIAYQITGLEALPFIYLEY